MNDILSLPDVKLSQLIDNRWESSSSIWDIISKTYTNNLKAYTNNPEWLSTLSKKKSKVRDNRIFVNTEAVINSVIANPPKPNIIPGRDTETSKTLASAQEKYFQIKYNDRNVKESIRKGLRNLYFSRIIILKPFWDISLNDFNVKALDPRSVRFSKTSTKEDDSEFAIEEITDNAQSLIAKFPAKKKEILSFCKTSEEDIAVNNPEIKYKEVWIGDNFICKLGDIILCKLKNPYWDWDGIQITQEENNLIQGDVSLETKRSTLYNAKIRQSADPKFKEQAYYYNHFDKPRKPYIFATMFNNENTPIGQTDFITQAIPLQEDIDETKRNITENAKIVNGIIKVDSSVMSQADANKIRFETGGVLWGKNIATGVTRETGSPLPNFVQMNLEDSRKEIDDLMAASSAFRGVREGQETRGGRLALIDQSFLRLNELVQVIDYVNNELFNWFYQLAKVNYTEHHYAKTLGYDRATEVLTLTQDDFEDGTEVRVIPGKTLPEDRQFKYEQAQKDFELGVLSPVDYLTIASYDNPSEKARNKVIYEINKPFAVGISPEELQQIAPPPAPAEDAPKTSIAYMDLPPDGKVQLAAKAGIQLDPQVVVAETIKQHQDNAIMNAQKQQNKTSTNTS